MSLKLPPPVTCCSKCLQEGGVPLTSKAEGTEWYVRWVDHRKVVDEREKVIDALLARIDALMGHEGV
jgi:hypothetical protein